MKESPRRREQKRRAAAAWRERHAHEAERMARIADQKRQSRARQDPNKDRWRRVLKEWHRSDFRGEIEQASAVGARHIDHPLLIYRDPHGKTSAEDYRTAEELLADHQKKMDTGDQDSLGHRPENRVQG